MDFDISIDVQCEKCGKGLNVEYWSETLTVTPCKCVKKPSVTRLCFRDFLDGKLDRFAWAAKAVSDDPSRKQLTRILVKDNQYIGSDGKRLHIADVPKGSPHYGINQPALIDPNSGDVDSDFEASTFPDYTKVIPDISKYEKRELSADKFEFYANYIDRVFAMVDGSTLLLDSVYLVEATTMTTDFYTPMPIGKFFSGPVVIKGAGTMAVIMPMRN